MAEKAKLNVYEIITGRIIDKLEEGVVPWHKPWKVYDDGMAHRNLVSGKPYRGVNAFMTHMSMFDDPHWVTPKQCKDKGGTIKKGEKATPIIFWNFFSKEKIAEAQAEGKKMAPFFVKYFNVFNVEQCEGLDIPKVTPIELENHERIERCEQVIKNMPKVPDIRERGNRACYYPTLDKVDMPQLGKFHTPEEYYSTLFHELCHATGHPSRVGRKDVMDPVKFGSHKYAKEELVAECGAAFLCGKMGIETTFDNSAAYIKSWLGKLKDDPKLVVHAAQAAQKAADYVLGDYVDYKKKDKEVELKKAA